MADRWQENLVVHYGTTSGQVAQMRDRSAAQKHTDHALDEATKAAEQALKLTNEATEWLASVSTVKNRDTAHYVKKLVEEITETRRVRG